MIGRRPAGQDDLDRFLAGLSKSSQVDGEGKSWLGRLLLGQRSEVAILALRTTLGCFDDRLLEPGHLYGVVRGRISLHWATQNADGGSKRLKFSRYIRGQVFGQLETDANSHSLGEVGLQAMPEPSRFCRTPQLLDIPAHVVAKLLENKGLKTSLARDFACRSQHFQRLMALRLLLEPALAVAHLCLSGFCGAPCPSGSDLAPRGQELQPDSTLGYLGMPVVIEKVVTKRELEDFACLSPNSVRSALALLQRLGYISTQGNTVATTHLTILQPTALLRALQRGVLTTAA